MNDYQHEIELFVYQFEGRWYSLSHPEIELPDHFDQLMDEFYPTHPDTETYPGKWKEEGHCWMIDEVREVEGSHVHRNVYGKTREALHERLESITGGNTDRWEIGQQIEAYEIYLYCDLEFTWHPGEPRITSGPSDNWYPGSPSYTEVNRAEWCRAPKHYPFNSNWWARENRVQEEEFLEALLDYDGELEEILEDHASSAAYEAELDEADRRYDEWKEERFAG